VPFSRTEPNVPAYEEDPNSPFTATNTTSKTFTLANPGNDLLILSDPDVRGFDQLQVNGVTSKRYEVVDNGNTVISDLDLFRIARGNLRSRLHIRAVGFGVSIATKQAEDSRDATVGGTTFDASGPITQFTMSDELGDKVDARLRVYALDV